MQLDLKSIKRRKGQKTDSLAPDLKKKRTGQVLTFLFFVFLSAIFWFIQSLQMRFPYVLHIPVVYDSIPPEIGLQGHPPEFIEVSLEDEGTNILEYSIQGTTPFRLKLKRQQDGNEGFTLSSTVLSQEVRKRLSTSARITAITPTSVDVVAYRRARKVVSITLGRLPLVAQGYSLGEVELTPSEVTIFAPAKVLDTIHTIRTAPFEEQLLEATTTTKVKLDLPEGVYASLSRVQAHLPVEQLTEQTFTLPVSVVGVPEGYSLLPLPSSVSLQITLPRSRYTEVRAEDFEVTVSYPLQEQTKQRETPRELVLELTKKPDWLRHYRLTPDRVQYVIEEHKVPKS
nr:CdaR family protein [uncultured Porphyromonas sp.]